MADELRAKIRASVTGMQEVEKLKNSMRQLASVAKPASADIDKLRSAALKLGNASDRTENELRTSISVLTDLRANVSLTSKRYQLLTRDINKTEAALAKSGSSGKGAAGRFGRTAKTIGAIAGAGIFGGPEGAAGALIGGIFGGPTGALTGGAVGAQVSILRKFAGQIAENVAQFRGYQIALAGISDSQEDYNESMKGMTEISKQFLIPQKDAIKQFTRLKASITGAGFTTAETTKVFKGMAAAILATGGSTHDLNSALVAAAQVFSKGKVSAEELRQQIGERLPGAFTIFADAMGISTKELDKMLERGEVDLTNFVKFSESIFARYSQIADQLADSPERAGQRLAVALSMAEIKFGGFFQVAGAGFQDWAKDIVDWTLDNEEQLKINIAKFAIFAEDVVYIFKEIAKNIFGVLKPVFEWVGERLNALTADIREDLLEGEFKQMMRDQPGYNRWKDRPILDLRKEALGNVDKRGIPEGSSRSKEYQVEYRKLLMERLGIAESEVAKISLLYEDKVTKKLEELFSLPGLQFGTAKGEGNGQGGGTQGKTAFDGLKEGIKSFGKEAGDVFSQVKAASEKALQGLEDQLVNFVTTGKLAFKDLARSILADMARIVIRKQILAPIIGAIFPSAKGNVFASNKIVPFAKGGIIDRPTIFPLKNGAALAGEAGEEAILPLRRGKGGRLGVESSGSGGGTSVVVNVDASGSDVQGDEDAGRQLGQLIAIAVQGKLIEQSRPGGLLNQS